MREYWQARELERVEGGRCETLARLTSEGGVMSLGFRV